MILPSLVFPAVSDVPSCGITYDHHSDASKGIIYDRYIFIIQATYFYQMIHQRTLAYRLVFLAATELKRAMVNIVFISQ